MTSYVPCSLELDDIGTIVGYKADGIILHPPYVIATVLLDIGSGWTVECEVEFECYIDPRSVHDVMSGAVGIRNITILDVNIVDMTSNVDDISCPYWHAYFKKKIESIRHRIGDQEIVVCIAQTVSKYHHKWCATLLDITASMLMSVSKSKVSGYQLRFVQPTKIVSVYAIQAQPKRLGIFLMCVLKKCNITQDYIAFFL